MTLISTSHNHLSSVTEGKGRQSFTKSTNFMHLVVSRSQRTCRFRSGCICWLPNTPTTTRGNSETRQGRWFGAMRLLCVMGFLITEPEWKRVNYAGDRAAQGGLIALQIHLMSALTDGTAVPPKAKLQHRNATKSN